MESQLQNDACSSTISLCYKSFDEFKSRIYQLKLSPFWNIAITADNIVKITCSDDIHIVPLFEIFCDESWSFSIRVLLRKLPSTHEIHTNYSCPCKNITLSNPIKVIESYQLWSGITDTSSMLTNGLIEHCIPKHHVPSDDETYFPLYQTKFCRSSSYSVLINMKSTCSSCIALEKK